MKQKSTLAQYGAETAEVFSRTPSYIKKPTDAKEKETV